MDEYVKLQIAYKKALINFINNIKVKKKCT